MTRDGWTQYGTRAVSLALFVAGLVHMPSGILGPAFVAVALVIIAVPRKTARPSDALAPDRLPAVIGPDLLGHLLTGFFVALPLWTGGNSGFTHSGVHVMAILLWPMAIGGVVLVVIAAANASRWMRIGDDALEVATARSHERIPYGEIIRAEPWRRGLPRVLRLLVPLLIAAGRFTAAGALTLARDSTGMRLVLADGRGIVIEKDAFEVPFRRLMRVLQRKGVVTAPQEEW